MAINNKSELNLLEAPDRDDGETVAVQSQQEDIAPITLTGYVDEDGVVRQESNGAAFNAEVYEVLDE